MTQALRLDDLNLPPKKAEDWRWTDLGALQAALAARANDVAPDPTLWRIEGVGGPLLLFIDGCYQPQLSDPQQVRIEAGAIEEASHPLGDVARRLATAGLTLRLEAGHATSGPVQLVHLATGGPAHLTHRIELGEDAQASVVETYVGAPDSWTNVAAQIALARSGRLMRTVRRIGQGGVHTELVRAEVGQGASYHATALLTGAVSIRSESQVRLTGLGAFASVDGVLLARERQTFDVVNRIIHEAEGGESRQSWRTVVDDQATASFSGRVEVARGAQKTDAEQSIKALVLKRTATANAKPELEIFADDVKCAHGATVGELDRNVLFYLASRGVPPQDARAILTRAFIADTLATIGEEAVRETVTADADHWLEGER